MGLTKFQVGELIRIVDERNSEGLKNFCGVNIKKEFMPTAANTEGLDETKYKIVRKNRYVFSGMQTGRDNCIRIAMYTGEEPIIVSPAYTTFEVFRNDVVNPTYFFLLFLSEEKDRLGSFYSDGSIRSNLDWDRFCEIELKLPSLPVQEKYVEIYRAMIVNQNNYERGLDDLKMAIDAVIDENKKSAKKMTVGSLLKEIDCRNDDCIITDVHGINITKQFMPSVANTEGVDLSRYKVVCNGQFAYSGMQTGRDECIRIALHRDEEPIIISPAYTVLEAINDSALPDYIMMWFSREESDRRGWFMSDSSIRSNLDLDRFFESEIPVPDIDIQKALSNMYCVYTKRRAIGEKLKSQIKEICPILIKGSIEEAMKEA